MCYSNTAQKFILNILHGHRILYTPNKEKNISLT